jgi:hypothetical protein
MGSVRTMSLSRNSKNRVEVRPFVKNIYHLINSGNVFDKDIITNSLFANEVVIDLNVLCQSMKDGVGSEGMLRV